MPCPKIVSGVRAYRPIAAVSFLAMVLCSCSSKTIYQWGSYEPSIGRLYDNEHVFQVEEEIEQLAMELEKTLPARIPPGKAAYLGSLYLQRGDVKIAEEFFKLEEKLFPESRAFMQRLQKGGKRS